MARTVGNIKRKRTTVGNKTNKQDFTTRGNNPSLKNFTSVLSFFDPISQRSWAFDAAKGTKNGRNYVKYSRGNGVSFTINTKTRAATLDSLYFNGRVHGNTIKGSENIPARAVVQVLKSGMVPRVSVINSSWYVHGDKRLPRMFLNSKHNLYSSFSPGYDFIPVTAVAKSFMSNRAMSEENIREKIRETEDAYPSMEKFTNDELRKMVAYSGGRHTQLDNYIAALNNSGLLKRAPHMQLHRTFPPYRF
jgi:hypothetical protein